MSARRALASAVLALAFIATGCAASQGEKEDPYIRPLAEGEIGRQFDCSIGLREFEDSAFGRLDGPVVFALDYCEPIGLERVRLEGGLQYTYDEADGTSAGQGVRLKGETFEVSAGLNYMYVFGRVRPYLGFGGSILSLDLRGIDEDVDLVFDDDDLTAGGYAKAGVLLQISPKSHLGLEYRHFEGGEASLDGTDLSTNYDQFLVVFGTSFQ